MPSWGRAKNWTTLCTQTIQRSKGIHTQIDAILFELCCRKKRSMLHVSSECFVPYGVSMMFTLDAIYATTLNQGVQIAVQNGFMIKFTNDVKWEMMRSSAGKRLAVVSL